MPQPRRRRGRRGSLAFHREHYDRLQFIVRAQALGFTLEAVGELLGICGGLLTCGDVYRVAQRTLAAARKLKFEPLPTLERLADACPRRGGAIDCPILAELRKSN